MSNDILRAVDRHEHMLLVVLDLSAALRGCLSKILRLISDQKIDFALTLPIDDT